VRGIALPQGLCVKVCVNPCHEGWLKYRAAFMARTKSSMDPEEYSWIRLQLWLWVHSSPGVMSLIYMVWRMAWFGAHMADCLVYSYENSLVNRHLRIVPGGTYSDLRLRAEYWGRMPGWYLAALLNFVVVRAIRACHFLMPMLEKPKFNGEGQPSPLAQLERWPIYCVGGQWRVLVEYRHLESWPRPHWHPANADGECHTYTCILL